MQPTPVSEFRGVAHHEAIDALLSEEFTNRETRRVSMALMTAKLLPPSH
ncbi:hypothetical protein [Parasedimentitalea psychrophila]|uniref:Uncharacterized protein n=1 Tax=Parasedimentitalea psychrophila TaxID=2997337 RepID=A0A9Y2L4G2_9RHOB|nr:hypothetical protein [Parasedimentitalea psychrophila]WIY27417.1 hypothetical protein QPJ95_11175 [Parasedimentitalea psychrophila]